MSRPTSFINFDPTKLGTAKVPMEESDGYELKPEELKKIFGIEPSRFGSLPKRIVVPILEGGWYTENWYYVKGWLYVVEPVSWVPQVSHERTEAASKFKKEYTKETRALSETKFNAAASAMLTISAGGSYMGVSAEVKASSEIKFDVSKSTTVDEKLRTSGEVGDVPVHEMFVYPNLRCKIIRKQRIDYTINDSSKELKWTPDSYNDGYWPARWVNDAHLAEVKKLAWNPVPMTGNGLPAKATILAAPQNTADGDVEISTVITREGWEGWYYYDVPWETVDNQHMLLAVPNNTIAFQPTATWTIL